MRWSKTLGCREGVYGELPSITAFVRFQPRREKLLGTLSLKLVHRSFLSDHDDGISPRRILKMTSHQFPDQSNPDSELSFYRAEGRCPLALQIVSPKHWAIKFQNLKLTVMPDIMLFWNLWSSEELRHLVEKKTLTGSCPPWLLRLVWNFQSNTCPTGRRRPSEIQMLELLSQILHSTSAST